MAAAASNNNLDFCPHLQKYSCLLSLFNSLIPLSLGGCLLLLPQTVIHVLLDYDLEATTNNKEVLFSLTQMAGGVLLAQDLSSFLLLVPLVQDISLRESSDPRTLLVTTSRTSIAVQSVTGLLWVIVGLSDDQVNESFGGGYRGETFGLLVVGFGILFLSCFTLMLSFWPVDYDAEHPETNQNNTSTVPPQNPDMEPLLAANHNQEEAPTTTHQEDEEEAAYCLLEDGPEEVAVERDNDNLDSNKDDDDESQASSSAPTSRIRGT
jgi:hypothetical protein